MNDGKGFKYCNWKIDIVQISNFHRSIPAGLYVNQCHYERLRLTYLKGSQSFLS